MPTMLPWPGLRPAIDRMPLSLGAWAIPAEGHSAAPEHGLAGAGWPPASQHAPACRMRALVHQVVSVNKKTMKKLSTRRQVLEEIATTEVPRPLPP